MRKNIKYINFKPFWKTTMDTNYEQPSSSVQLPLPYTRKLEETGKAMAEGARFGKWLITPEGKRSLETALDAADESARALDAQVRMPSEKGRVYLRV